VHAGRRQRRRDPQEARRDPGELPADKARALVFYCANEQCGASHTAAEKARLAGYRDVRVLPAGIFGWIDAGKTVEPG
jgi:rhodanese-related sulfurtransferase